MSKQPLSSLSAIPLKGSAARPEVIPDAGGEGRAGQRDSEPPPALATASPLQQAEAAKVHAPPSFSVPPTEEPRSALTVRLKVGTQERLREMAHRTRRQKQDLVEDALLAFMERFGF